MRINVSADHCRAPDVAGTDFLHEGNDAPFGFTGGQRNVLGETGMAFEGADLAQTADDGDVLQVAALIFAAKNMRGRAVLGQGQVHLAAVLAGIDLHADAAARSHHSHGQFLRASRRADGGKSAAAIAAG